MLKAIINFSRSHNVDLKPDLAETIGQTSLGLLRIAFGKTVKVSKMNKKLQFEDIRYSTAVRVSAAAVAILTLPATLILTGTGILCLAASRTHRVVHSYWKNSQYPAYIDPQNEIIKKVDKCVIHHKSADKYVLILKAPPIENLVISGGGAKGVTLIGAIKAFELTGSRKQIKRVAGSSVGAVSAALFAAGVSADTISQESGKQNFKFLLGKSNHWLGLYKDGTPLLQFLRDTIHQAVNNALDETAPIQLDPKKPLLTFKMLRQLHQWKPEIFKELTVTVTNTATGKTEYLNADTAPDVEIALACRASAALPGILSPVHINGKTYVDGGYLDNIPVSCFESEKKANLKTLAIVFDETGRKEGEQSPFWNVRRRKYELYKPSFLDRMMRDVAAKKLAGIQTEERNTERKLEGLEDVRERYMQRNLALAVSLKTRDFDKAKQQDKKYREAGFRQTLAYLNLHKDECLYYVFKTKKELDAFLKTTGQNVSL